MRRINLNPAIFICVLVVLLSAYAQDGCQEFLNQIYPKANTAIAPEQQKAESLVLVNVARAIDGDTVELANGDKLRYIGVDAPELHHPKKPVEAFAKEAWEANRNLVEGKQIRIEFDVQRRDKYNRILAYVFLKDETFVNAELIKQGYAQVMTIPPNVRYQKLFLQLQREAKESKRGLWRGE